MNIRVVEYRDRYKDAFKELNKQWIEKYFRMERADYDALDNPEQNILRKGGHILFVLVNDQPVATAALIRSNRPEYDYELAKMAVDPVFQGQRLGVLILEDIIDKAKEIGAKTIYLESSTKLIGALKLYRRAGFVEVTGNESPYERSDIQMMLELKEEPSEESA